MARVIKNVAFIINLDLSAAFCEDTSFENHAIALKTLGLPAS
jgi:hypothetical protein